MTILDEITVLLFDLDNTLLFIDENEFVFSYATNAATYFKDVFPDPKTFVYHLLEGTKFMVSTKSHEPNIEKFFHYFLPKCNGLSKDVVYQRFLDFYTKDFDNVKKIVKTNSIVKKIFKVALEKNYEIVIATDPLFPEIATLKRINWAGLENFIPKIKLITHGEQFFTTKIDVEYYQQIIDILGVQANKCMMIGNDFYKDGLANMLGMKYYQIITNTKEADFLKENIKRKEENENIKISGAGSLEEFYQILMQ